MDLYPQGFFFSARLTPGDRSGAMVLILGSTLGRSFYIPRNPRRSASPAQALRKE
jgi:hypothetical protein